jgi:hypothetical protein
MSLGFALGRKLRFPCCRFGVHPYQQGQKSLPRRSKFPFPIALMPDSGYTDKGHLRGFKYHRRGCASKAW